MITIAIYIPMSTYKSIRRNPWRIRIPSTYYIWLTYYTYYTIYVSIIYSIYLVLWPEDLYILNIFKWNMATKWTEYKGQRECNLYLTISTCLRVNFNILFKFIFIQISDAWQRKQVLSVAKILINIPIVSFLNLNVLLQPSPI